MSKVAKGRLGLARPFIDCDDTDLLYEEGSDLDEVRTRMGQRAIYYIDLGR